MDNVVEEAKREIIRQAMSILGSRTSERKKASSRANAKRPRKKRETKTDILHSS